MQWQYPILGLALLAAELGAASGQELRLRGKVIASADLFAQPPAHPGQDRHQWALRLQPELRYTTNAGATWTIEPSIGFASQSQREPEIDLRKAKVELGGEDWRLVVGADVVFWGVTEVAQLTDIVNQTDLAADPFGNAKLGQPMVRLSRLSDLGLFELYYFPLSRVRTFPDHDGRLRLQPYVKEDDALWDTDLEEVEPSFALRYQNSLDRLDLGVFGYRGVAREPAFVPGNGFLRPFYALIAQIGVDVQWTQNATLFKLEAVGTRDQPDRRLRRSDTVAAAFGLEHTVFGIAASEKDLAVIVEYSFDSRGGEALQPLQNDATAGFRLAFNDTGSTELRLLATKDLSFDTLSFQVRAAKRLSDSWHFSMEGVFFSTVDQRDFLYDFRRDSFLRLQLERYF